MKFSKFLSTPLVLSLLATQFAKAAIVDPPESDCDDQGIKELILDESHHFWSQLPEGGEPLRLFCVAQLEREHKLEERLKGLEKTVAQVTGECIALREQHEDKRKRSSESPEESDRKVVKYNLETLADFKERNTEDRRDEEIQAIKRAVNDLTRAFLAGKKQLKETIIETFPINVLFGGKITLNQKHPLLKHSLDDIPNDVKVLLVSIFYRHEASGQSHGFLSGYLFQDGDRKNRTPYKSTNFQRFGNSDYVVLEVPWSNEHPKRICFAVTNSHNTRPINNPHGLNYFEIGYSGWRRNVSIYE